MIAIVTGVIAEREEDALVLMAGGLGYRVHVSKRLLDTVTVGEPLELYTHLNVREDAFLLFGFATKEERQMFVKLQNANGIGPKLALQVLSHLEVPELLRALAEEDVKRFTQVPGVGAKTASRIILELKGSLASWTGGTSAEGGVIGGSTAVRKGPLVDIEEALLQLGFGEREVAPVLAELAPQMANLTVNEGIRRALFALGR